MLKSSKLVLNENLPTWGGALNSLISNSKLPIMQTGFLTFIPLPVAEHAIVYAAMENFIKVLQQLDQKAFADFLWWRCLPHCISAMFRGFSPGEMCAALYWKVYTRNRFRWRSRGNSSIWKKVMEQVLNGAHYIRLLRAILILVDSINRLKWDAFWENNNNNNNNIYIYIYIYI